MSNISDQIAAIKKSGLFDSDWYRAKYFDVDMVGLDALEHYVRFGGIMGRNPSPAFDSIGYLTDYPDVANAGMNPLYHFIIAGKSEGRRARPLQTPPSPIAAGIAFSVIMPTRDRADCIEQAIYSLLAQTYQAFELIIVDDGSKDGTEKIVKSRYREFLDCRRIVYVKCEESNGVCAARNIGISKAKNNWIAYLDSDNAVRPYYLEVVAEEISKNEGRATFYANFQLNENGKVGGRSFDYKKLQEANFIDLGVFFHRRDCFEKLGGFDESLKRLVDWDLIIRYTKAYPPVHIQRVLMDYSNRESPDRITRKESYPKARIQIHRKHKIRDTVSVIIVCYNQEKYIAKALTSALAQKGDFTYEIIVSDDGSADGTPKIIEDFCKKHPKIMRRIGGTQNVGISANFKRCFEEAAGEFVAVLEGDDYWLDDRNLKDKLEFIRKNPECSMVFSKTQMLFEEKGELEIRYLDRQNRIASNKVTGLDFLLDPSMNLIVNFSSCFFRTDLMRTLPQRIYDYRLSEISVAFFLEQHGPIGYINKPLSAYRHHGGGAWSGLNRADQLRSALNVRQVVKDVARSEYKEVIEAIIQERYVAKLRELGQHL